MSVIICKNNLELHIKIVEKASVNGAVVKKEKGHIEQYPDWDDDDYDEIVEDLD